MKKWFGTLVCVWLLAGGAKSGLFDQIARMLSSVAQVSESAANVASVVLDGSADFATSTTNAVLSFSTGSVNVARTAWRGVDLVNVNCTKTAGKVIGASAQAVARWFNSSLGKTVTQANFSEPIHLWTALAYSVTAELHTLHAMKDYLDVRLVLAGTGNRYTHWFSKFRDGVQLHSGCFCCTMGKSALGSAEYQCPRRKCAGNYPGAGIRGCSAGAKRDLAHRVRQLDCEHG